MNDMQRIARTIIPENRRIKFILDTDAFNEVDDQFAVVYTMLSTERLDVQAIYSAQFVNSPKVMSHYRSQTLSDSLNLFQNASSETPSQGQELSYQEICTLLNLMNIDHHNFAYRGSSSRLTSPDTAVESPAACDFIQRAMNMPEGELLYIAGIGSLTNIASAIILEPEIINKIVVIWLVGNTYDWIDNNEFNFYQDPIATEVLFASGVPLIQVPAKGLTGHLRISIPELDAYMGSDNPLTAHLYNRVHGYTKESFCWSKPIWDVGVVGLAVNPRWSTTRVVHSPVFSTLQHYSFPCNSPLIRCVSSLERDNIFADMFRKIRTFVGK